jgi:hypothetical protein
MLLNYIFENEILFWKYITKFKIIFILLNVDNLKLETSEICFMQISLWQALEMNKKKIKIWATVIELL